MVFTAQLCTSGGCNCISSSSSSGSKRSDEWGEEVGSGQSLKKSCNIARGALWGECGTGVRHRSPCGGVARRAFSAGP